jgi:hypothetical protein
MTFDELERWAEREKERHQALTQTVEVLGHDIQELAERRRNIRALARIAEMHDRRISKLEGSE